MPSSRDRAPSPASPADDSIMTSVLRDFVSVCIRLATSKPSIAGMCASRSTSVNGSPRSSAAVMASSAF